MTRMSRLNILPQAIEGARIDAGQPHRVGAALAVGSASSFSHDEIVGRCRRWKYPLSSSSCRRCRSSFLFGEQRVHHRGGFIANVKRAQCLDAVFQQVRNAATRLGIALHFAVGRIGMSNASSAASSSAFPASCAATPGRARACPSTAIFASAPRPRRLLSAVDPDFERDGYARFRGVGNEDHEAGRADVSPPAIPSLRCRRAAWGRPASANEASAGLGAASSTMRRSWSKHQVLRLLFFLYGRCFPG